MENKFKELIEFFELKEGYSMKEVIDDMVGETKLLRHEEMGEHTLSMDECSIEWGDGYVCLLEDFVNRYTDVVIEKVVYVIKTFECVA